RSLLTTPPPPLLSGWLSARLDSELIRTAFGSPFPATSTSWWVVGCLRALSGLLVLPRERSRFRTVWLPPVSRLRLPTRLTGSRELSSRSSWRTVLGTWFPRRAPRIVRLLSGSVSLVGKPLKFM